MRVPAVHVAPDTCGEEGYGLYLAGYMLKKDYVLVKGIADYGDGVKDYKYHRTCYYASAWFVMRFIKAML